MYPRESRPPAGLMMVLLLLFTLLMFWIGRIGGQENVGTFQQLKKEVENGTVNRVEVSQNNEVPTGSAVVRLKNGERFKVNVSDVKDLQEFLDEAECEYVVYDVPKKDVFLTIILPILIGIGLIVFLIVFMTNRALGQGGGAGPMTNFGRSRARMIKETNKDFSQVAGLQEEKQDLEEIVDFLKNPSKYTRMGARIPKGVLLVGPPGTGKTLLAKAVAGEAGVPFFTISGSDFVEMFVGVGASRVRDMFEDAKQNAPCIVFIDEIDAVGRRRGTGMGGGHDEREQTLNQLLVEMDGFSTNEGIIVMAATNRVDILDPAILRAGRFDRKISVGVPDVRGREAILHVHAKDKPLSDDVDFDRIARTTAGFTGADLENLMNEAAIEAARKDQPCIRQADIDAAFIRVGIGKEKKSKIISDRDKRITAYHETGHAILFHVLPDVGPVHTVSVIPTGLGAAGYTMPVPERDEMFNTRGKMLQMIMVDLGGRIAEELVLDDITTGASQDIKQATSLARAMVTKYGMSKEVGLISYGEGSEDVFIGLELGHGRSYGENMATRIDDEVKNIIDDCYEKAKAIINSHRDILDKCADLLMEKEKITGAEFEALFSEN